MPTNAHFRGFPKESVAFLKELADNNNKTWFADHKGDFEKHLMEPARDFVYEMGNRIKEISPKVIADPKVDRSIFRLYRDTRFSKDKTPYKTHLGIFFWEGTRPKMECPGYYFHLEPPDLMLAAGMHCFPKSLLGRYRDWVVHPLHGPELAKAVGEVTAAGDYQVGGVHYKKTPRGYDANHENAEFLLHDGLYAAFHTQIPKELHSKDLLEYCLIRFRDMSPLHEWLVHMTAEE
ncbi:MAG: DUF2461 domain-containing protein [Thermodesulfobacteriota bacterium]